MSGQIPFFIEGKVVDFSMEHNIAYVKVPNGNVYHVRQDTPGLDFNKIVKGQIIKLEITNMLTRVLSASIIENNSGVGKHGNPPGS